VRKWFLRDLEPERFGMDLLRRHPEPRGCVDHHGAELSGPADVDIADGDVGNAAAQRASVERHLVPWAHDLMEPASALLDQGGDLAPVYQVMDG
jgi:hypothetical protein